MSVTPQSPPPTHTFFLLLSPDVAWDLEVGAAVAVVGWCVIKMSCRELSPQFLILCMLTATHLSSDCCPVQKSSPSPNLTIFIKYNLTTLHLSKLTLWCSYRRF